MSQRLRPWMGTVIVLSMINCSLRAQQKSALPPHCALYIVGYREAIKFDFPSGSMKKWRLLTQAGMHEDEVCSSLHPPLSGDWYSSETRLDLPNRRVYFVAPTEALGDAPETLEELEAEERIGRPYAVWVLDLYDMKLLKRLDMPEPGELPTIILKPGVKQMLVSYGIPGSKQVLVDTLDTITFKKISAVKDSSGDVLNTAFYTDTYFLSSGNAIVGSGPGAWSRIRVESGHFKEETMDPRTELPPKEQKKLSAFMKTAEDGQRFLPVYPDSTRNGRVLVSVANEARTATAFWTLDMETGATSTSVITNTLANGELFGPAKEFIVSAVRIAPAAADRPTSLANSGHFAVYDVKSGALVKEFDSTALQGKTRMICSSEDGGLAAYVREHDLMILNLQTGQVTQFLGQLTDPPVPGGSGACAFAMN